MKYIDDKWKYDIDWSLLDDGNYDLRKALIKCDKETGHFVHDTKYEWSYCDVNDSLNKSTVTD